MTTTEATAYNCVRRGVARTRAELAKVMGVSRPTASAVTETLLASGLVREGGKCSSSGGRSPTLLIPRADAFSLIGIDLAASGRIFGVRVDALGDVVGRADVLSAPDGPEQTAEEILRIWRRLDPADEALGVGIAMNHCAAAGRALVKALRRHLIGKYIHVSERLVAEALSEGFRGGAAVERNFLLLGGGGSPRAVICIDGRPFFGTHGTAGELRRRPAAAGCGATGAAALAAECAPALRCVLAMFDPGALVLAGCFARSGGDFHRCLEHMLESSPCRVIPAKFGEFSAARGAALQTHFSI